MDKLQKIIKKLIENPPKQPVTRKNNINYMNKDLMKYGAVIIPNDTKIEFVPDYPKMIKEIKHEIGLSLLDSEDEYEEGAKFLAEAIDKIIDKYEKGVK